MIDDNPHRVQLKRTKGWRMPDNTLKVDRSTRWGNPWTAGVMGPYSLCPMNANEAVTIFEQMLGRPEMRKDLGYPADLSPLKGKNLACWCPINAPECHADVLLRLANAS